MKTAVSIPDRIFRDAEALARRLRLSRSRLYAEALEAVVRRHQGDDVTRALDRVYSDVSSSLDPALSAMQLASLRPGRW